MRQMVPALLIAITLPAGAQTLASARPSPTVDDSRVLSILDAANAAEINAAQKASTQATRPEVKEFASQLLRDHQGAQAQVRDLAKKLNVMPGPLDASMPLKKELDSGAQKLQGATGEAFDKAFLESQVSAHQAVLEAVATEQGATANAEIRALVDRVKPTLEAHLKQAQKLLETQK